MLPEAQCGPNQCFSATYLFVFKNSCVGIDRHEEVSWAWHVLPVGNANSPEQSSQCLVGVSGVYIHPAFSIIVLQGYCHTDTTTVGNSPFVMRSGYFLISPNDLP